MKTKEFIAKLGWLKLPKEWAEDKKLKEEMLSDLQKRLAYIRLGEDKLQRLFDFLFEHEEFFPAWSKIRSAMLELDLIESEKKYRAEWEFFEKDGVRYARRIETVRIPRVSN